MNSTPNPNSTESDDVLVARAEERFAHAYEEITRADEQLARVNEQLSRLERDAADHPEAIPGRRPSRGRPALRGLVGLLLAACIAVAAFVSQSSYGEGARLTFARWTAPHLVSASSLPGKPGLSAQPAQSGVRVAVAEAAPQQAAPWAQAAPQDVAPAAAPASPDLAQLLQTMARDLATVEQGIEQLKASQERLASDNARIVEQLRMSQDQMARLVARASEQDLRSRTPAPPPKPIANSTHNPAPPHPSPQARARPQPIQLQPDDQ